MEIKRIGSQPSVKGPSEWFTGTVRIDPLFQAPDPALVQGASVTFEPGARTAWHTSPYRKASTGRLSTGWNRSATNNFRPDERTETINRSKNYPIHVNDPFPTWINRIHRIGRRPRLKSSKSTLKVVETSPARIFVPSIYPVHPAYPCL